MAIERLSEGKTVVAIAHRLSTISNYDLILVMKKGRIVERGTHEELLQLQGEYSHLWQTQQHQKGEKEEEEVQE